MSVKCYGSTAVSKTASQSSTLCTLAKIVLDNSKYLCYNIRVSQGENDMEKFIIAICWFGTITVPFAYYIAVSSIPQ